MASPQNPEVEFQPGYADSEDGKRSDFDSEEDDDLFYGEEGDEGIQVICRVGPLLFPLSVGDGYQDIRWLSLVASQRYSSFVQAKGKQRQREETCLKAGNFLPTCVFLLDKMIEPSTKICDALAKRSANLARRRKGRKGKDSEDAAGIPEFRVDLLKQVELGEDGAPKLEPWLANAFTHSSAGKARVRHLKEKAAKEQRAEEGFDSDDEEEAVAMDRLAPGQVGLFNDGPASVAAALEVDWERITASERFAEWFHTAEYAKLDTEKEARVRAALLDGMEPLCSLMDHYSWEWRRAPCSISAAELRHLLHFCQVISLPQDSEKLSTAIQAVVESTPSSLHSSSGFGNNPRIKTVLLDRAQVILVLLSLASEMSKPASFAARVEEYFTDCITPTAEALRSTASERGPAVVRRVLARSSVIKMFRSRRREDRAAAGALRNVYHQFCLASLAKGEEPTMQLREFGLFLNDAMPSDFDTEAKQGGSESNTSESDSDSSQGAREGKEGDAAATEGKTEDESVVKSRLRANAFASAQRLLARDKHDAAPLEELIFAEFVFALLLTMYQRELERDTWDSKHGAKHLLAVAEHLKSLVCDDDEL